MAAFFQPVADRGDAAVHHVRRRDDIGTCLRLDQGLANQHLGRLVVENIAFGIDDAVMAVAGVGIERDIGQHTDLRHRIFDRLDRAAHEIVRIERLAPVIGTQFVGRVREQGQAGNARFGRQPGALGKPVDAPPRHAGQRANRLLAGLAVANEQRPDEVARVQAVLGEHGPHPRA